MDRGPRRIPWGGLLVGLLAGVLLVSAVPVIADIGDPILQGTVNVADRRTTLSGADGGDAMLLVTNKAENGAGIEIRVEPGRPPLVVHSKARVRRLNADLLDGKSSGAFLKKAVYDKDRDRVIDNAERLDGLDSDEFVTKSGSFSCPGNTWTAASSYNDYQTSGPLMYVGVGSASVFFRCGISLPQGVEVTSAAFAVQDSSSGATVECALFRSGLVTAIGTTNNVVSSLVTSGAPGATVLSTNQVTFGLIDNSRYAYYAGCTVIEDGWDTGIYGVTVSYTAP